MIKGKRVIRVRKRDLIDRAIMNAETLRRDIDAIDSSGGPVDDPDICWAANSLRGTVALLERARKRAVRP